ncbi:MAG: hypothetical protein ACXVXG_13365 [Nocardioidaceae bacterium]
MRLTRLLAHLPVPALLGLPMLVLGAGAAGAQTTVDTTLAIQRYPAVQRYGSHVGVAGRLTSTADASAVGGQTVRLERQGATEADFTTVDTGTTDDTGAVTFLETAESNAQFRLVFDGGTDAAGDTLNASTSVARSSKVARALNSTVTNDGPVIFKGNVDPGYGNETMYLQRKTCKGCTWKAYAKQQTGANGSWRFRVAEPKNGTWYYRARTTADQDFVASYALLEVMHF